MLPALFLASTLAPALTSSLTDWLNPCQAASCRAVLPSLSCLSKAQPSCINTARISLCPTTAARCRAVWFPSSCMFSSHPAFNRIWTTLRCPLWAARCKGVRPCLVTATLAPLLISCTTLSTWPLYAATSRRSDSAATTSCWLMNWKREVLKTSSG